MAAILAAEFLAPVPCNCDDTSHMEGLNEGSYGPNEADGAGKTNMQVCC